MHLLKGCLFILQRHSFQLRQWDVIHPHSPFPLFLLHKLFSPPKIPNSPFAPWEIWWSLSLSKLVCFFVIWFDSLLRQLQPWDNRKYSAQTEKRHSVHRLFLCHRRPGFPVVKLLWRFIGPLQRLYSVYSLCSKCSFLFIYFLTLFFSDALRGKSRTWTGNGRRSALCAEKMLLACLACNWQWHLFGCRVLRIELNINRKSRPI